MVAAWHEKRKPHGVKVKSLTNRVYEIGWKRFVNRTLNVQMFIPQAVPHSNAELQQEEEEVPVGSTQLSSMITAASMARSSQEGISENELAAAYEGDPSVTKLLNPLQSFASPQEKLAQAYADRWTEECMSRDMLDAIEWADYCPGDRKNDLYKVFELGMKYVDEFDNAVVNRWNMDEVPTHMRVWLAELEWTWNDLMARNWLPQDCRSPHDKFIRERALGADGHVDPGNMVYDTMVNLLRM